MAIMPDAYAIVFQKASKATILNSNHAELDEIAEPARKLKVVMEAGSAAALILAWGTIVQEADFLGCGVKLYLGHEFPTYASLWGSQGEQSKRNGLDLVVKPNFC